jgi:HemY protein
MRTIEVAWNANPHPDLADAYAHVRLGDSARERLARVELLAQKAPDHRESRLAIARAAIEASEFGRAREALAPLLTTMTQRVALLMAELERAGNHDEGRAREWTARAVRAAPDPAWTADGYVSDRWRPVSPVTGRLDAFQWVTPVAALTSDHVDVAAEASHLPEKLPEPASVAIESKVAPAEPEPAVEKAPVEAAPAPVKTDNVAPPVFRARPAGEARSPAPSAIIPLVRAPDDPGVPEDDFSDDPDAAHDRQPGGWRGFVSRLGG